MLLAKYRRQKRCSEHVEPQLLHQHYPVRKNTGIGPYTDSYKNWLSQLVAAELEVQAGLRPWHTPQHFGLTFQKTVFFRVLKKVLLRTR